MHCIKEATKAQNSRQADSNIAVTPEDLQAEQTATTPEEPRLKA